MQKAPSPGPPVYLTIQHAFSDRPNEADALGLRLTLPTPDLLAEAVHL